MSVDISNLDKMPTVRKSGDRKPRNAYTYLRDMRQHITSPLAANRQMIKDKHFADRQVERNKDRKNDP